MKKLKTFVKLLAVALIFSGGYWLGSIAPMKVVIQAVDQIQSSNELTRECVDSLRDSIELNQMYREKYGDLDAAFL